MQSKDLVPPLFLKGLKAARSTLRKQSQHLATFSSYSEAASHCVGFGYEASDVVEMVCRKTAIYRDLCNSQDGADLTTSDTLALFGIGLAHGHSRPINLIDFGGACGAHYFRIKSFFRDS